LDRRYDRTASYHGTHTEDRAALADRGDWLLRVLVLCGSDVFLARAVSVYRKEGIMAHFTIYGAVPNDVLEDFLQLMRDFERRDPEEIHLAVSIDVSELSVKQVTLLLDSKEVPFAHRASNEIVKRAFEIADLFVDFAERRKIPRCRIREADKRKEKTKS
jgi:hypothetical protein